MYGTIAKLVIKPGQEDAFREYANRMGSNNPAGAVRMMVYRLDNEPNTLMMAVAFDSKEAYRANAESPEQHQRYLEMMQYLAREPEWHDGEIVASD